MPKQESEPQPSALEQKQTHEDSQLLGQAGQILDAISQIKPEKNTQEISKLIEEVGLLYEEIGPPQYKKGDIVKAKITRLENAGIFVKLPGKNMEIWCPPHYFKPEMYDQLQVGAVFEFEVKETDERSNYMDLRPIEGKERQMEFTDHDTGLRIKVNDETKKYGLTIGQKLKAKDPLSVSQGIRDAKELTIVGFMNDGGITTQLDDGSVVVHPERWHKDLFDPIEEQSERQMEFTTNDGEKFRVNNKLEKDGLRVGQKLKPKKGSAFYESGEEFIIVGFNGEEDLPVIQIDGKGIIFLPAKVVKSSFEPIEPINENEKRDFSVELRGFEPTKKLNTIKGIRTLMGNNLFEAKHIAEASMWGPQVIKEDLTQEEAEEIKKEFEAFGGKIEIKKQERQMEFESITGTKHTVTDELEKNGFKVGQKLKIQDYLLKSKAPSEFTKSEAFEVVGFEGPHVIIQLDSGKVMAWTRDQIERGFKFP